MRQYIRSMLVQCHLPTDIKIIKSCHQQYGDNQPVLHSVVYWPPEAWLILFSCECIGVLHTSWWSWTICKDLSFHMKATYLPLHLLSFEHSYADVQFDTHTQKCGNFEKTMRMTSSHPKHLYFRTWLNIVNIGKWQSNVALTEVQT